MKPTLAGHLDERATPTQSSQFIDRHGQRPFKKVYPPDTDIMRWLANNAPATFHELMNIRYSLYHRCSRAEYRVKRLNDEELSTHTTKTA